MTTGKISDYITFPNTFENYKWYKPILVFIIGLVIMLILGSLVIIAFGTIYGFDFINTIFSGGYEALTSEAALLFTDLMIIVIIPSLYLASKIVKDRPFSSYSSSRGGWNIKLYFKALIIPLILYIIVNGIETTIKGPTGAFHFSIIILIMTFISQPLQCIAEEYLYRGFIMQTFGSWFKIPVLAILIQTIVFSLSHGYNGMGLTTVFVSGILWGFLTWKTNGIEVSSALHTANNVSFSLFVLFGLESPTSTLQFGDVVIDVAFQIILFAIMYYVGTKTNWFGEIPENTQNI